jgi:hypothetical protein
MNDLFVWALSLPSFVIVGIVGAIAGAIGALLGAAAQKLFGQNKAWRIVPVIFVVGSVQLTTQSLLPSLQQDAAPYEAIRVMKQYPIFGAIFKYHPDAEVETAKKLKEVMSGPSNGRGVAARAVGATLADKYVNLHILMASDDAIHSLLLSEAAIVRSVRSQPDACVALYLGTANAPVDKLSPELVNEKLNARADVIETSVTRPSPPTTTVTVDALAKILVRAYQNNGFDINEISKLSDVGGSLPSKEGCDIANHFLSVMTSLDPKEGATVYKGLLTLK